MAAREAPHSMSKDDSAETVSAVHNKPNTHQMHKSTGMYIHGPTCVCMDSHEQHQSRLSRVYGKYIYGSWQVSGGTLQQA